MNNNITFKLSSNTITVSEIKREVDYKSLNNTNVIDVKELKFSLNYIKENYELVSSFLSVVLIKKNITTVIINNMDISLILMDLINSWDHIDTVIFKPDKKVGFDIFLKLLDNRSIKKIECFEMSEYLVERLDINKNIKVKTRHKIESASKFNSINMLNSYSDIYYKKVIVLSCEFNNDELDDLRTFINLNSRLKVIKIVNYSNELLTSIIEELKANNKKNILIEIYEKENNLDAIFNSVNYMKKKNKNFFEKNKIRFKLNYSSEYKSNNFFKEVNFKLLIYIITSIIILSILVTVLYYNQQRRDQDKIDNTMENINEIINDFTTTTTTEAISNEITTTTEVIDPIYYTNFSQVYDELKKINSDTVGWIKVNNTKINYPVVQSKRNNYYLGRDFSKKKNSYGWIFMDYRNNPEKLDQNTILYGHNVRSGIMFGTMSNMMYPNWYDKEKNQVITFNTINKNMKWRIFSIYRVTTTVDYLKTNFENRKEFMEFIEMVKARSKKDFNVEVKPGDKVLTMQTCKGEADKYVVHAVLIEEEDITEN